MAKDMAKNRTGGSQASAAELYDFMKKVREDGYVSLVPSATARDSRGIFEIHVLREREPIVIRVVTACSSSRRPVRLSAEHTSNRDL